MTPGEIAILTGPSGSGKTTIAEALASASDARAVHLRSDEFWGFIKKGLVAPYLPQADRQNAVVFAALAATSAIFARGGYFVVMDGIVGPSALDHFRKLGVGLHYVVLRPSLRTTLARAQRRQGSLLSASGPLKQLHRQFEALGKLEKHAIDTSDHRPAESLAAVRAALASGRFRLT